VFVRLELFIHGGTEALNSSLMRKTPCTQKELRKTKLCLTENGIYCYVTLALSSSLSEIGLMHA
jgi:hypothetical protein